MTKLSSVTVLSGGISHERDVSIRSGRRVAEALKQHSLKVNLLDPDASLLGKLLADPPDVIWPVLHGNSGEDGTLFDLLSRLNLPYVGSPASAARLAWNKSVAKTIVSNNGIKTPESLTISRDVFRELGASGVLTFISDKFSFPLVVKPVQGGSAQGVTLVNNSEDLARAMVNAYTYCDSALIERKIIGTEVAVGIIDSGDGPVALPLVEIVPLNGVYSFEERYNAGETEFFTPARLSNEVSSLVAQEAILAHTSLGLQDISRIDFIIDPDNTIFFLEANVIPGLTETSLLPLALEKAGHDLGFVYYALAKNAAVAKK